MSHNGRRHGSRICWPASDVHMPEFARMSPFQAYVNEFLPEVPRRDSVLDRSPSRSSSRLSFGSRSPPELQAERLTTSAEIQRLHLNDKVTLVLRYKIGGSNPQYASYFVNCATADNEKVVVKAYEKQADILSTRTSTRNSVIKFVDLTVKQARNRNNSDVDFDFVFGPSSRAELVRADELTPEVHDFEDVIGLQGRLIKVFGTVVLEPYAQSASTLLQVADDFGEKLTIRVSPQSFFTDAIRCGRKYSFTGTLHNSGGIELHVAMPAAPTIAEV